MNSIETKQETKPDLSRRVRAARLVEIEWAAGIKRSSKLLCRCRVRFADNVEQSIDITVANCDALKWLSFRKAALERADLLLENGLSESWDRAVFAAMERGEVVR